MTYVVAATWYAREGAEERIREILERLTPQVREEPGCRMWQVHRSPDDPRLFFLYEQYDDEAAFEAHTATPHVERYVRGEAIPLLERRERAFYHTVD
jgi:quinol monooxygenase YgiN